MEDFVPTHVSSTKSSAQKDFVCVAYKNISKKRNSVIFKQNTTYNKTNAKETKQSKQKDLKRQQELEMKAARYDVIKYGMTGFEKTKVETAKIGVAISLGAKPPKNKMINYKQLKLIKKNAKIQPNGEKVSSFSNHVLKNVKKNYKTPSIKILGSYGAITSKKVIARK